MAARTDYIELTSSNRNRVLYPLPSSFDSPISQTGVGNNVTAQDPVCDSAALKYWNMSFRNDAISNTVAIASFALGVSGQTDVKTLQIKTSRGALRQELNFYDGSVLQIDFGDGSVAYRRIIWYEYIDDDGTNDNGLVWVETAIGNTTLAGATGSLNDPTMKTDAASGYPQVFLPQGEDVDNFYVNCVLDNIDQKESATVIKYDGITHMLTLSAPTATNWVTTTGLGAHSYNLVLRKAPVMWTSTFSHNTGGAIFNLALAANTVAQLGDGLYVGNYMRMIDPPPVPSFSTTVAPYGQNAKITKYISLNTTIAAVIATGLGDGTITFANGVQEDNYYNGCIITDDTAGEYNIIISSYDGATRTATILSGLTGAENVNDVLRIRTAFTAGFSGSFGLGVSEYEMLAFTTDNFSPYNYFGGMVGQQEAVCYEIELLNLVLPNIVLNVGRGGRIVFYPYVYVALHNSTQYASRNSIYSNNPAASKMLFRATVNDTSSPLITPFIRISGNGMRQIVKFKPNDNLHFSVHLPDGRLFSVDEAETFAPLPPNPLIQISAVFACRRV